MAKELDMAALQAWFGEAIARPLPDEYRGNPLAASAPELGAEAGARIASRGGLTGFERLGVYNQQYWFRLITIMQDEYPCVVHLLGLRPFNDWVTRYLTAHPPSSPYLSHLDAEWPAFLEANYRGADREAVLQGAAYDRALSKAVDAPSGASLVGLDPARAMGLRLCLAPHATPLELGWDFAAFRAECLRDESLEEAIDLKPGGSCVMVYRDAACVLRVATLAATARKVLAEMRAPSPIPEIFARLEGRLSGAEEAELEANLAEWFKDWVTQGWICGEDSAQE